MLLTILTAVIGALTAYILHRRTIFFRGENERLRRFSNESIRALTTQAQDLKTENERLHGIANEALHHSRLAAGLLGPLQQEVAMLEENLTEVDLRMEAVREMFIRRLREDGLEEDEINEILLQFEIPHAER